MIRKIILYLVISLFVISASWNYYYSIITFIASNLSVRQSFYFENEVNKKGTHWGAITYGQTNRQHKLDLAKFNYSNVLSAFIDVNQMDPLKTNYSKEYRLINLLFKLSKLLKSYKKQTALYIPKTLDVYWNLSCDTHMPSFVAPAIANMAMIEGLPMRDQTTSCFTHFNEYGYLTYLIRGIKANIIEMDHNKICQKAKQNGFKRIIEINENKIGDIITINHECVD